MVVTLLAAEKGPNEDVDDHIVCADDADAKAELRDPEADRG